MEFASAYDLATNYGRVRKEVRKALLAKLRELDKIESANSTSKVGQGRVLEPNERRKLCSYPSDLTDQRLLEFYQRFVDRGFK